MLNNIMDLGKFKCGDCFRYSKCEDTILWNFKI